MLKQSILLVHCCTLYVNSNMHSPEVNLLAKPHWAKSKHFHFGLRLNVCSAAMM